MGPSHERLAKARTRSPFRGAIVFASASLVGCSSTDLVVFGADSGALLDASVIVDASERDAQTMDGATSRDASMQFDSCKGPSDCILATGCCGESCGEGSLTDYTPINRTQAADYRAATCEPLVGCLPCAPSPTKHVASYVATCTSGTCSSVDVRVNAVSACQDDSECVVRANACCECGANTDPYRGLVAIARSKVAEFTLMVCDPNASCRECLPQYPRSVVPRCVRNHCVTEVITVSDAGR